MAGVTRPPAGRRGGARPRLGRVDLGRCSTAHRRGELDRAGGGRLVYLSQASIHSALCSTALLAAGPAEAVLDGRYDGSGWLRARRPPRGAGDRARARSRRPSAGWPQTGGAARAAAALGIAAVHECGGPGTSDEADFTGLLALGGAGNGRPEVYGYWGELVGAAKARELGAVGAGGDLYADGALGSRTAHLREPYVDVPTARAGTATSPPSRSREHLVDVHRRTACRAGSTRSATRPSPPCWPGSARPPRRSGWTGCGRRGTASSTSRSWTRRSSPALVEFGIVASMQPAFDRLWGGAGQMYAAAPGRGPVAGVQPDGRHARGRGGAGVRLGLAGDPAGPVGQPCGPRLAPPHPAHRMSARAAFAAHTRGGWRAVHRDDEGVLGARAPGRRSRSGTPRRAARTARPARRSDARTQPPPGAAHPAVAPSCAAPRSTTAGATRRDRQAGSGPGAGGAGPGAGRARPAQPVVDLARSHTTVGGGAGGAAPGRHRRAPTRTASRGSTGSSTRSRPTSASGTGWRCRCGTPWPARASTT